MKHLRYVRYLIAHKWGVFRAGLRLKVPLWRLIIHDWSKLMPCEWFPYANHFFRGDPRKDRMHEPGDAEAFDRAWLHHLHLNPHHWQHWVPAGADPLKMPYHFVCEMVADWIGAGYAQGFKFGDRMSVMEWYAKTKDRMQLHPTTRAVVENLLRRWREYVI